MKTAIMTVGFALALALPTAGQAGGVLYSYGHTLHFPEPLNVDCLAQNFNPSAQTLTIDAIDGLGTVVNTTGPLTLAPGQAAELLNTNGGPLMIACRYTVGGSAKKWRGAAIVFGNDFVLRDTIDAR
jgi:hypothetical protein